MHRSTLARLSLLALSMLLMLAQAPAPARAQGADLDVSVFYDELEPYGRWFSHPRYGYVWSPNVDEDWRPYSRGHWIYTDENGWYWEAEEPWGWGPFHYGRWVFDDDAGWVWIPGTEWGPAWVAWRYSDEYVGWAPLPPEAEWYEDRGLAFSASYYDGPRFAPFWVFVAPRYMVLPGCYRYALPRARNHIAIRGTRWGTHYRFANRHVFNAGYDVRRFERVTGRPISRVRLVTSDRPHGPGFLAGDRSRLRVYRPHLKVGLNPVPPPRLHDAPQRRGGDRSGSQVGRPAGFTPPDKGGPGPGLSGQPQPRWKQPNDNALQHRPPGQDAGHPAWKGPQTGTNTPPRQYHPEMLRQQQPSGLQRQPNPSGGGQPRPQQFKAHGQPPPQQQLRQQAPPPQRGPSPQDARKKPPEQGVGGLLR